MKMFLSALLILVLLGAWGICYSVAQQASEEEKSFVYEHHEKRDPFWPLVSPTGNILDYEKKEFQVTDLKLEGIIFEPDGKNLAIINGQIVKKKDQLGLFTVGVIGKDSVTLTKGQQEFKLRLKRED